MINARDLDYIETRLLAPCVAASEAHERLQKNAATLELEEQTNRLLYAMQIFTDTCRDIRKQIVLIEYHRHA